MPKHYHYFPGLQTLIMHLHLHLLNMAVSSGSCLATTSGASTSSTSKNASRNDPLIWQELSNRFVVQSLVLIYGDIWWPVSSSGHSSSSCTLVKPILNWLKPAGWNKTKPWGAQRNKMMATATIPLMTFLATGTRWSFTRSVHGTTFPCNSWLTCHIQLLLLPANTKPAALAWRHFKQSLMGCWSMLDLHQ